MLKRSISLLIAFCVVFSSSFLLWGCGDDESNGDGDGTQNGSNTQDGSNDNTQGDGGETPEETIDFTGGTNKYKLIYDSFSVKVATIASGLRYDIDQITGVKLSTASSNSSKTDHEILIGVTSRDESKAGEEIVAHMSSSAVGSIHIAVYGEKLVVIGDDEDSLSAAVDMLEENYLSEEGLIVPKDLNMTKYYDKKIYKAEARIEEYTEDELKSLALLSDISIDGKTLSGFSSDRFEYTVTLPFGSEYPRVSATAFSPLNQTPVIVEANEDNDGVCTVSIKNSDGSVEKTYRVVFDVLDTIAADAEVVYKDGADGIMTITVDDGTLSTGQMVSNTVLNYYPSLKVTFSMIIKKIATIQTTGGTEYEYVKDSDGSYVYTTNSNYSGWQQIMSHPNFDIASHSYTHNYWGKDDNGGYETFKDNRGNVHSNVYFPSGNVTLEVCTSAEILRELFPGLRILAFVIPGVGAPHSSYTNNMIANNDTYIGARNTSGTKLNYPDSTLNRFSLNSYMVEYYGASSVVTTTSSTIPADILAAGVGKWKEYVDSAIENNGWGIFTFHEVINDYVQGSGHYVYLSQFSDICSYIDSKVQSGEIWSATLEEAMLYVFEMQTASVEAVNYRNEKITVTVTDEEDDEIFDMALTVKVSVPDSWTSAYAGGAELEIMNDGSGNFVYVDVVPDGEAAVITTGASN